MRHPMCGLSCSVVCIGVMRGSVPHPAPVLNCSMAMLYLHALLGAVDYQQHASVLSPPTCPFVLC